jgi:hypothetical protein
MSVDRAGQERGVEFQDLRDRRRLRDRSGGGYAVPLGHITVLGHQFGLAVEDAGRCTGRCPGRTVQQPSRASRGAQSPYSRYKLCAVNGKELSCPERRR